MSQPVTSTENSQTSPATAEQPGWAADDPATEIEREMALDLETGTNFSILDRLGERLRYEVLLSRLSADFIHLPPNKVDGRIYRALQQIVEYLEIERCGLAQFSENGRELLATHSYAIPRFTPFPRTDIAVIFPWLTAKIRQGEMVRLTRLPDELPPEAEAERQYCRLAGMRSCLAIPFTVGGSVLGGIGFESYDKNLNWTDHLENLTLVSEIFANALARKHTDNVLRESEERFRLMADTAPVMIWMSGPDKLCTYFNHRWLDFTGRPKERELGNGWSEGVHPDDLERCLEKYVQAFDARQKFRMEYRLRRFDGQYRWVFDSGAPRFEGDGTFKGYIGSCIDITDQKRMEEGLREREARLRGLLHAEEESRRLREQLARVGRVSIMGELSASIAHEVNQPLCAIFSNAQTVQRMLKGGGFVLEDLLEAVADITKDAQRAHEVIARIRGLLQNAPVLRVPIDINELIRDMVALMHGELTRKEINVCLELTEPLPMVQCDKVQLQQVILNLMTNAAAALDGVAQESRQMTICSSLDGFRSVTVAVKDSGVGLDPKNVDRIFEPFFTTRGGGTGIGLDICKSINNDHGGKIGAGPNAGGGAVFQFTLPSSVA
jgi:PAS domain S-box-containing protein